MKNDRSAVRVVIPSAVVLVIAVSTVLFTTDLMAQEDRQKIILSGARGQTKTPTPTPPRPTPTPRPTATPTGLTMSQMKGSWTATFSGLTGCGVATEYYEFTLDEFGKGTQSVHSSHTAGCGDNPASGLSVEIQDLNPDGSGFIAFECGVGCGFGFFFQVSRNREMFNMAPQEVGGNYLSGVAVRK